MKMNQFSCLLVLLFLYCTAGAQNKPSILLRSGPVTITQDLTQTSLDSFNTKSTRTYGKSFGLIQFDQIPNNETRKYLSASGIELLDYIPQNAYTVSISGNLMMPVLEQARARAVIRLLPEQKMEDRLARGQVPASAVKQAGTADVWISFPHTYNQQEVLTSLKENNIDIISTKLAWQRILHIRIDPLRLKELASYPFVEFVQPAPAGDQLLNYNSRYVSGANVLNTSLLNGGKGLNGEGIVIGVGDNADIQTHIDFAGRLINRAAAPLTSGHGHHVSGTVGGAGNGNELYRGYASRSTIVSQAFNGIILNAPSYVADYGMVVTNNSYGDNIECGYYGSYDLYSRLLDQMAIDYPNLQNVFSSGNSGAQTCIPFAPNYHTVLGGYQSAKNVITVGATTDSGIVAGFSSRGPVRDGRIKPEIVAMGQRVASTWSGNIYSYNNGTSMSGPAVAGGLALLYQRYRQLNSGANPKNGLMKALLCNGALDKGNAGPDYQYGFGWMNLLRSVDMLEKSRYFIAGTAQGVTNTHTINVPSGISQMKVLVYWNDPAASPLSSVTLVNDLDLEVSGGATTTLPRILDTSNANLGQTAVNGADHLNNMEQVVISNPSAGSYTIRVKGTAITQNPSQEYFLVYDLIGQELKITAPAGGESLSPSTVTEDMLKICWESYGYNGTGTLEFSADNGNSWTTLASGININRPVFTWWVPNVATGEARVRITRDGTGESSTSQPFSIVAAPTITLAPVQCEGYISLDWTSVPGATDYEVFILQGQEMKPVAVSTGNNYVFSGLSKDSTYHVSVRARVNGKGGRRARSLAVVPSSGSCTGTISDNDLKLESILSPVSGRRFTTTQPSAASLVSVRIKNLDDAAVNSFDLKYSVNGGPYVTETINTPIGAGASYTHNFSTTVDLSSVGIYSITAVVVNNTADPVSMNDTAHVRVKHLDNQALNLTAYFVDDIEAAVPATYQRDTIGIEGLDRYDFSRTTSFGRLRTFLNTGMAHSGNKALTLDISRLLVAGNVSYAYGTYNLSNYSIGANDLRLDFQFNNHGQQPHPENKVWIRGNDVSPWIEAYDLDNNQEDPGQYKKTHSIEVSDLLAANSQNLGTSFQVRWGQFGQIAATELSYGSGYSFDDIRIYEVFNDLQMQSIDAPGAASCGLTASTPISISVRNSANATLTAVPVRYRVNNGSWITETIPSISPNTTIQYSFSIPANLSGLGTYTIQAIVDFGADSFRENDTTTLTMIHSPVISSFPYLENFEAGNGYWYAQGKHSSWEYGTPGSNKINRAASGVKAWKTRLRGNYNDLELSYLYSPCFNISGMTQPTVSFSAALDIEDCGNQLCDGAWVEYSTDGISWIKLGASGSGTNWYNKATDQLWSIQDFTRWHVVTSALPTGFSQLRLRIVLATDPAANREGIAIDDIHVYDNTNGIYEGPSLTSPIVQTVSGSNWTHFTSGGKLLSSVRAGSANLGSTAVQAFINAGPVRYTNAQYYHDRSLTIQPANDLTGDSVMVRFYFTERETDSLVKASGCPSCNKPASAYELGVSQYSDPDNSFENGSISDNQQGIWHYISSDSLKIVPFDKGYYAEFKVGSFSEFWLNSGGFNRSAPLPVKLLEFTAQKTGLTEVLLKWKLGSEDNVVRYEVEVARSAAEMQAGQWSKLGEVASLGNTTSTRNYSFTDTEPGKYGTRFYRLKTVNVDGSFSYSPVRTVSFEEAVLWQVFPNPSKGHFSLIFQIPQNEVLDARIVDAQGRTIRAYQVISNGNVQKLNIDLLLAASGVYLLELNTGGDKRSFKLYKQ